MKSIYIIVLISCSMSVFGCGKKNEVLAKIDNKSITTKDFEKRIAALPPRYQDLINENKRKFLDELIVDELLYMEAFNKGLERDKEVKDVIQEAKKKILIAKLLQTQIDETAKVTDEEISEYYNANKEEFKTPEIFRASHILVRNEDEAKEILRELASGRNFEDLARARSIDPTAQRGGDIGYFIQGQLDPDFEKPCVELKPGEISDVIKTRFGYHIIKMTEIKPPAYEKFDDVKERIKQNLLVVNKKKQFNNLVERLKDKAKIEVNEKSSLFGQPEDDKK